MHSIQLYLVLLDGKLYTFILFFKFICMLLFRNYLNFVTEEIKEPKKNLPRAIYISVPLVAFIYVFVTLSYLAVSTPEQVASYDAVAVNFAKQLFGPVAGIVPILISFSCIGTLNGIIFTCSRMFFAGARLEF